MTVQQSLKSITAYPIPTATLQDIAEGCGLGIDEDVSPDRQQSKELKRAKARIYIYLITAPNISQNGISFSFTAEERKQFKVIAKDLLRQVGDDTSILSNGVKYGYVGENF